MNWERDQETNKCLKLSQSIYSILGKNGVHLTPFYFEAQCSFVAQVSPELLGSRHALPHTVSQGMLTPSEKIIR